jgi:hypothetical protein
MNSANRNCAQRGLAALLLPTPLDDWFYLTPTTCPPGRIQDFQRSWRLLPGMGARKEKGGGNYGKRPRLARRN